MNTKALHTQLLAEAAIQGAQQSEALFGLHALGYGINELAELLQMDEEVVGALIVQAIADRPRQERRERRVTFELHRALVGHLERSPGPVIEKALDNLAEIRGRLRGDQVSKRWADQWEQLLLGDVNTLKRTMLEVSEELEDLRQMSPFVGVLSQEERLLAIKKATTKPMSK